MRLAVDASGNPWMVNSAHHVYHWNGRGWALYPGAASAISVGANESVWAVGTNPVGGGFGIYHWTGSGWTSMRAAR